MSDAASPSTPADDALLSARNVHKTYCMGRVDVPVLTGATLDVKRGEWLAVLGASGSGKSTLLHLLGDLDEVDPEGGEILFGNRPLTAFSQHARNRYRNRSVGFVESLAEVKPLTDVWAVRQGWAAYTLYTGRLEQYSDPQTRIEL